MSTQMIADDTLVIRRTFAAPVERVYRAWTDPAQLVRWFLPNSRWNAPTADIDPVPGGAYTITMNHSDGDVFQMVGRYVDVVPNERLSFTWAVLGGSVSPDESLVTIELREVADGTELTLIHDRLTGSDDRNSVSDGWTGLLGTLETYLGG